MRAIHLAILSSALASALLLSAPAHANGRFPAADQIAFAPGSVDFVVVRVTFGLLLSKDGGKSWDWVCERALGYNRSEEDPSIAVTGRTNLLLGVLDQFFVTEDQGCNWNRPGGELDGPSTVVDLALDPADGATAFALVSDYVDTDGSVPLY